jgi:hypothetical protein
MEGTIGTINMITLSSVLTVCDGQLKAERSTVERVLMRHCPKPYARLS